MVKESNHGISGDGEKVVFGTRSTGGIYSWEFPDYVNAKIFAEAYTNHFYTKTTIVKKGA